MLSCREHSQKQGQMLQPKFAKRSTPPILEKCGILCYKIIIAPTRANRKIMLLNIFPKNQDFRLYFFTKNLLYCNLTPVGAIHFCQL